MTQLLIGASEALRPHLSAVAITLSVTLLAIFGNDINSRVKRLVVRHPFPVRVAAFIVLVAFGYGAASLVISRFMASMLMQIDSHYLAPVVLIAFIVLGVLAEHKGHI